MEVFFYFSATKLFTRDLNFHLNLLDCICLSPRIWTIKVSATKLCGGEKKRTLPSIVHDCAAALPVVHRRRIVNGSSSLTCKFMCLWLSSISGLEQSTEAMDSLLLCASFSVDTSVVNSQHRSDSSLKNFFVCNLNKFLYLYNCILVVWYCIFT